MQGRCLAVTEHKVANTVAIPIPDGNTMGVESSNPIVGLAGKHLVDLYMTAAIHHPSPSDLLITLRQPSGIELVVWDHEPWEEEQLSLHRKPEGLLFEDEMVVEGEWVLRLVDDTPSNVGELDRWSLVLLLADEPLAP